VRVVRPTHSEIEKGRHRPGDAGPLEKQYFKGFIFLFKKTKTAVREPKDLKPAAKAYQTSILQDHTLKSVFGMASLLYEEGGFFYGKK